MTKTFLVALLITSVNVAKADQCAYVTKAQAAKALAILAEVSSYKDFCSPCGDERAKEVQINQFGMRRTSTTPYWEVFVNNTGIDLAYTYAQGVNLAKLADCEVHDVPETID